MFRARSLLLRLMASLFLLTLSSSLVLWISHVGNSNNTDAMQRVDAIVTDRDFDDNETFSICGGTMAAPQFKEPDILR